MYDNLPSTGLREATTVPWNELEYNFSEYVDRIRAKNDWGQIRQLDLASTYIYLWDHKMSIEFDIVGGLKRVDCTKDECDIQMSSDSLSFIMQFEWGRGTLCVNAKFVANYESVGRFFSQTQIAYANNIGHTYPGQLTKEAICNPPSFVAQIAEIRRAGKLPDSSLG